jgi:predicted HTH domain antitoxin
VEPHGLQPWEDVSFMELLGDFGVNLDYDEEDLDADLRTIRGLKSGGNM